MSSKRLACCKVTQLLALALGSSAPACVTGPARPLPDPLPETLDWAQDMGRQGAFLGLEVRENDSGSLENLFFEPGARVVAVVENSPAAEAGVRPGDVLLEFDDAPVNDPVALDNLLRWDRAPGPVTLRVQRADSVFDVHLTLAERGSDIPPPALVWRADPARSRAGWISGRGGVVLVSADARGPVARAGLPLGATVTDLDGRSVHSARELIRSLQARPPGTTVEMGYTTRDGVAQRTHVRLLDVPQRVLEAKLPVLIGYESDPEGENVSFYLVDLWFVWLLRYERAGSEKRWSVLRFFKFSTGMGELSE